MNTRKIAPLALVLTLAACAEPAAPTDVVAQDRAIVGGHEVDTDPAIVMIFAYGRGGGTCTGTVIAPRVVLTAAHCVDPAELGSQISFVIYNGQSINDAQFTEFVKAKEAVMHPQYSGANIGQYDLGLLIFGKDIAFGGQAVTPMPWMRRAITDDMIGQTARLVGYGVTSGDENAYDSGIKRETTTPLSEYDDNLVGFDEPEHNMCSGDSGGPVLMMVDGVETLVGVNSFVVYPYCEAGGFSTRVDQYVDWIDQVIEEKTGYVHPSKRPMKVLGDACVEHKECVSNVCAWDSKTSTGYCTQTCDPKMPAPAGYYCATIDGSPLLVRGTKPKEGCDATGGADVSGLSLLIVGAMSLIRRRRA